ncbi:hypothetical protein ACIF8T_21595 [Streptomyces sp. NPDC085946]|uniref:hypothetical protein n=1 Tax=Streptomyces sp. NPDC085946 TaxID=3365744 RepID=UPI0037D556C8
MGQNLLRIATELVTEGARHGSPSMLMRRLNQDHNVQITFEAARAILAQLYAAGIVAPVDPATHAHPVLLDREEALAAIDNYTSVGPTNWSDLYECPQCCRVAPWTDGRSRAAGDEVDEFWCQTCGAEVPITACAKTELLAA